MRTLLILFALSISTVWTQNCNNPLLSAFSLDALPNPQSVSDLPYCANLQSGQTCCSADTVNNFQTLADNLALQLQQAAAARDTYLVDLRNSYLTQYQVLANTLNVYRSSISNLTSRNTILGNTASAQANVLSDIATQLDDLDNDFDGALRDYQAARVSCFLTVLQVQASAWCEACNPNWATNGVLPNGTIILSNTLCNRISDACYPYLETANQLNPLIQARQAFVRLQNLNSYLASFASRGVIPNVTYSGDIYNPTSAAQETVAFPPNCDDENNCIWQCQNLFPGGNLNVTLAGNGAGVLGGDNVRLGALGGILAPPVQQVAPAPVVNVTPAVVQTTPVVAAVPAAVPVVAATNATTAVPVVVANNTNSRLLQNTATTSTPAVETVPVATAPATVPVAVVTPVAITTVTAATVNPGVWSPNIDSTGLLYNVVSDPAGVFSVGMSGMGASGTINNPYVSSGSVMVVRAVGVVCMIILTLF